MWSQPHTQVNLFTELLNSVKDINSITIELKQDKLIHLAVFYNKIEAIELLINRGVKIGVRNSENDTALIVSIKNNYTKLAKLLLKNGAISFQNTDEVGYIFKLVIENDNYELAESLVSNLVNVNQLISTKDCIFSEEYKLYESQVTLLKFAILRKSLKFIDFLLQNGAAKEPVQDLIRSIIENTPRINDDEKQDNELLRLEQEKNHEFIKFLYSRKFPINLDKLLYVAVNESNLKYAKLFISLGANVNQNIQSTFYDKDNFSLLMTAINIGNKELIELLINVKADVGYNSTKSNVVTKEHSLEIDYTKVTPLHLAICKGDISIIDVLIDGEADVNHVYTIQQYRISNAGNYVAEGPETKTPLLSLAIESNKLEIVKHLIIAGASIYPKGVENNQTPLFKALQLNSDEMMLFILEYGVPKESIQELKKQISNDIFKQEWFKKILQEAQISRD